jgi:integrase
VPTGKITKIAADRAPEGLLWDTEVKGFGLRVGKGGTKSFVFQYRMGGREAKTGRHLIGRLGDWTPEEARTEAKRLAQLVDRGVDPADEKRERRRETVDLAFDKYVETFGSKYLANRWKNDGEALRLLRREAIPVLRSKPLPRVARGDITEVIDGLQGRPATARLVFALLRRLFSWAVERGDLQRSPVDGQKGPNPVPARERVLSDAEIADLWQATDNLSAARGVYRLLLLTGQRLNEVSRLSWDELAREEQSWALPGTRTKNGLPHVVPLSTQSIAILDGIAGSEKWPRKGFVFPASAGDGALWIGGKIKKSLDQALVELRVQQAGPDAKPVPFPAWRNHDLRRTVATGLQRLGVRLEVTEAILNHVSGSRSGIVGVYQKHDWQNEKRAALSAWAAHLDCAITPTLISELDQ